MIQAVTGWCLAISVAVFSAFSQATATQIGQTRISADVIHQQAINSIDKLGLHLPNVNLATATDGFINVNMRGLGVFRSAYWGYRVQGAGIYLDGVQQLGNLSQSWGDLASIEVLQGAQGTLYGGGNIGGTIQLNTARPELEQSFSRLELKAGQQNQRQLHITLNQPLNENWTMRLFAFHDEHDGYLKNLNPARKNGLRSNHSQHIDAHQEKGVRLSLAGAINERISTYASVRWNDIDSGGELWLREALGSKFRYKRHMNHSDPSRQQRDAVSAVLEFTINGERFKWLSLMGYGQADSNSLKDLDMTQEFRSNLNGKRETDSLSWQLQVSPQDSEQWLAGLYASQAKYKSSDNACMYDSFMPLMMERTPTAAQEQKKNCTDFASYHWQDQRLAAFAQYRWSLSDSVDLELGARIERWSTKQQQLSSDSTTIGHKADWQLQTHAVLSKRFSEQAKGYLRYAEGYQPGGVNKSAISSVKAKHLDTFNAQQAKSLELGWQQSLLNKRLHWQLALFYIDNQDSQFYDHLRVKGKAQPEEGISNVGDSEHQGVEASLQFNATEQLTLVARLGRTSAKYQKDLHVIDILGLFTPLQYPPNSQDFSWHLGVNYQRPVFADVQFVAGTQINRQGGFWGSFDKYRATKHPHRVLLHAQMGLQTANWQLMLRGQNITDEGYVKELQSGMIGEGGAVRAGTLGQPRLLSLSLRYQF